MRPERETTDVTSVYDGTDSDYQPAGSGSVSGNDTGAEAEKSLDPAKNKYYRAFRIAVIRGLPMTTGVYLSALSTMPHYSESDFPERFSLKHWQRYVSACAERVHLLRQDAANSRYIDDDKVMHRFNADLIIEGVFTDSKNVTLFRLMTQDGLEDYCEQRGITKVPRLRPRMVAIYSETVEGDMMDKDDGSSNDSSCGSCDGSDTDLIEPVPKVGNKRSARKHVRTAKKARISKD